MNQLKESEKKATQLVSDARKARVDKMKEAKTEAEQIIAAYRAEMEANYQAKLAKLTGKSGTAGNELQTSTTNEIASMNREYNQNKEKVMKMLIDMVINVDLKAPQARTH